MARFQVTISQIAKEVYEWRLVDAETGNTKTGQADSPTKAEEAVASAAADIQIAAAPVIVKQYEI